MLSTPFVVHQTIAASVGCLSNAGPGRDGKHGVLGAAPTVVSDWQARCPTRIGAEHAFMHHAHTALAAVSAGSFHSPHTLSLGSASGVQCKKGKTPSAVQIAVAVAPCGACYAAALFAMAAIFLTRYKYHYSPHAAAVVA